LPDRYRKAATLTKPIDPAQLDAALATLLAGSPANPFT
jgi:hypothetical protein